MPIAPATAAAPYLRVEHGPGGRVCSVCGKAVNVFAPGPGGHRPDASCPSCRSLERHRFLSLAAGGLVSATKGHGVLLDVAPMQATADLLRAAAGGAGAGYVSIDFDPEADNRIVDVAASLTHLPLPDASVALVVCMHVLEHIPDDAAAMRELARCLAPGGIGLVQVPWRKGATDEDPSAGPEERIRRFGQVDHVRYYGDDFEDRLRAAGLRVDRFTPSQVLPPGVTTLLGLLPEEPFWLCTVGDPSDPDHVADPIATLRQSMATAFAAVLSRAVAAVLAERQATASAPAPTSAASPAADLRRRGRSAYVTLRRTPPGKLAARVVRRIRTK